MFNENIRINNLEYKAIRVSLKPQDLNLFFSYCVAHPYLWMVNICFVSHGDVLVGEGCIYDFLDTLDHLNIIPCNVLHDKALRKIYQDYRQIRKNEESKEE